MMSLLLVLRRCYETLFQKISGFLTSSKYNEWTIAEYFRKQGAHVGDNCRFHIRSLGEEPYLVNIGNNVFVAQRVIFHTHDGAVWIFKKEIPDIEVFGPIVIEDNCLIGADSHLLPNIRIGRNSIIGANSVVISDVPADSIVMGVPARVVGSNLRYKEKCIARWKEQKPPGFKGFEQGKDWLASRGYQESRKILRRHLERLFEIDPPH